VVKWTVHILSLIIRPRVFLNLYDLFFTQIEKSMGSKISIKISCFVVCVKSWNYTGANK